MSQENDQDINMEVDQEAAMREMMGFSSFATGHHPKGSKPLSASGPASTTQDSNTNAAENTGLLSTATDAEGADPSQAATNDAATTTATASKPSDGERPKSDQPPKQKEPVYAFVSPETCISYTQEELDEWAQGKVNERGDKVYFHPDFVCDDPWAHLRGPKDGGDGPSSG